MEVVCLLKKLLAERGEVPFGRWMVNSFIKSCTPFVSMVESVKSGNSAIPLAPPCPPQPTDVIDIVFNDTSKEILVCVHSY